MKIPVLSLIDDIALARERLLKDPHERPAFEQLQRWRVDRLQRTYADYYRQERYRSGLDFFTRDLYGTHDFNSRDRELRKVMHMWCRVLPERALAAIERALGLELLSLALDAQMVAALHGGEITTESYANAYREVGRRPDRERQISLIVSAGRSLDELIGHKWIPAALRMARRPARLAGVSQLHEFLERGYGAFAKMHGADQLLSVIEERETVILKNLFASAPHPFDVIEADALAGRKAQ